MRLRHHLLLVAGLAAALIAPAVRAQVSTPLTIQDGNGAKPTLCEYKPDGSNMAGCTVKWIWTGSAWVLEPADTSGRPYVDVYSLPNVTLGAGSSTIGNIGNTSFGISGSLPAFASTPTFNLGTLNGAATATNQTAVQSAPGTSAGTAVTVQGDASGVPVPITGTVSDSGLESSASTIATNTTGAAKDGTDASGVTPPSGAVGIRGWLSGVYKTLTGTLTVKQVDSGGGDATDPTNHALRINCVTGCSGGGGAVTLGTGAVASGAFTAGSVVSGAYAVGAIGDLGANGTLHQDLQSGACNKIVPVNISASTDVYASTAKAHVCAVVLQSAVAQAATIVEGAGTMCATGIAAFLGGSTTADASHGYQWFAGQGLNTVSGIPFAQTQTAGDHICILLGTGAGGGGVGLLTGFISLSDN